MEKTHGELNNLDMSGSVPGNCRFVAYSYKIILDKFAGRVCSLPPTRRNRLRAMANALVTNLHRHGQRRKCGSGVDFSGSPGPYVVAHCSIKLCLS